MWLRVSNRRPTAVGGACWGALCLWFVRWHRGPGGVRMLRSVLRCNRTYKDTSDDAVATLSKELDLQSGN